MPPPVQSYTWQRLAFGLARCVEQFTGLTASAAAGTNTAQVSWARSDQGPLPKPYVGIEKLFAQNIGFAQEGPPRTVPTTQRLTITQTVDDEPVVLNLIWAEVRTLKQGGDTPTDTRDKFLAQCLAVVAETKEPLLFAADGVADILITAKPSAIPDVEVVQGCTLAVPGEVEETLELNSVNRRYRVRIKFYGFHLTNPTNEDTIEDEYTSEMQSKLESRAGLDFLQQYGLGVDGSPSTAQDVAIQMGPLWEHQVSFDINIVTTRLTYAPVIETVDLVDPPVIEGVIG